jgi:chromosome segregation ATPase
LAENVEAEFKKMMADYEDLKVKAASLQSDLGAAQQLATSRYKDLTELRDILQKAQPELKSLRAENTTLKSAKEELTARTAELRRLEGREKDLKVEFASFKKQATDREAEMKTLNEKIAQEINGRLKAEDQCRIAGRDLRRAEADKIELSATGEKAARELSKVQDESARLRGRVQELEAQVAKLSTDNQNLRDEIELKGSQYISAQSLVGSMRDQAVEMATQLKEAKEQADSLEEELNEVQRLLSERTREGETMRRLLQDVDDRADTKVREMRERMEAAIEERDRAEDEASTHGRRRAREIEDLKNKIRDMERDLKRANDDREELEISQKEWRWRREELENISGRATQEVSEIRNAMEELRGALDESEKQAREAEKQKTDLRRLLGDANQKYEKLQRSLKAKQQRLDELTSGTSSRSSTERDSSPARALNGTSNSMTDYVYLKTVLLQFLEQKDKKLQVQLVPVLGKLLRFDKYVHSRKFYIRHPLHSDLLTYDIEKTSRNGWRQSR